MQQAIHKWDRLVDYHQVQDQTLHSVIRMFNMLMTEMMLQNPRSVGERHEFHLRFFVDNN